MLNDIKIFIRSWGEKQKLTSAQIAGGAGNGTPLQSSLTHATSTDELPPAELAQLLVFIETANTLIKWVLMFSHYLHKFIKIYLWISLTKNFDG